MDRVHPRLRKVLEQAERIEGEPLAMDVEIQPNFIERSRLHYIVTGLTDQQMIRGLLEMPPHTKYVADATNGDTVYFTYCSCDPDNRHFEIHILQPPVVVSIGYLTTYIDGEHEIYSVTELHGLEVALDYWNLRNVSWSQVEIDQESSNG